MAVLEWQEWLGNWRGHRPRTDTDPEYGPGYLAVRVIRYTRANWVDGADGIQRRGNDEHYWAVIYTRPHERLPDNYGSVDEAKAAAEEHLAAHDAP